MESDLNVQLAPFSKTVPAGLSQLDCFIQIEEPEHPLEFRASLMAEEEIVRVLLAVAVAVVAWISLKACHSSSSAS